MHSRLIALAVGLLAVPLALAATPGTASSQASLFPVAALPEDSVNGHLLTPAPMPSELPPGVPAVDRVAAPGRHTLSAGATNSTPFSDTPTGTLSEGGAQGSQRDRTMSPADTSGETPNLGK